VSQPVAWPPPAIYSRPSIVPAVAVPRATDIGAIVDHVSIAGLYAKSAMKPTSPLRTTSACLQ
jgi:hypothetical protein